MPSLTPAMVNGLNLNGNHANGNGVHSHTSDSGSETSGESSNGSGPRRMKLKRKMSSPMAPPFMVSAPGKVIVFGEHSVVHGKV
jgi:mevalonate kinase